ncbi:MAG TPA: MATE family efflux transporter, partial [Syntrophales bacterium]
ADPILGLFTNDRELIAIAAPALKIFVTPLILAGPSLVWINLFIGLGKGLTSMILLFIRDALFLIPLMYLFSALMGRDGVWMAQPVSATIAFFVIMVWSYKELEGVRKKGGQIENAPVSSDDTGASLS